MTDTIAAIATGVEVAAIGIVRVSGPLAIAVADKAFRAMGGARMKDTADRQMHYGEFRGKSGGLLDICMCMVSRAPNSYTGEDTAEFHCHGSPVVLTEVLGELFARGVRQALPGEFTKRAFLNGRMDLTQAEAVIDLIESETPGAAKNAAGQLSGTVAKRLAPVYDALVDIMAHFHAVIDYPDEDIDDFKMNHYLVGLRGAEEELTRMLETHESGKIMRSGVPTAIIGRPNTGKSSLLNALVGYDRAIVTDIPGTTRDTIEEKVIVGGRLLRIIDTAGLRKTDDVVENLGIGRTRDAISGAGLVILVIDGSQPLCDEDREAFFAVPVGVPYIAAVNKCDLPSAVGNGQLQAMGLNFFRISAVTEEGLAELRNEIKTLLPKVAADPHGEIITNARQADAILRARTAIGQSITAIEESVTPDAVLMEVESALAAIGEVTGSVMREDIVGRIFERFCVGK